MGKGHYLLFKTNIKYSPINIFLSYSLAITVLFFQIFFHIIFYWCYWNFLIFILNLLPFWRKPEFNINQHICYLCLACHTDPVCFVHSLDFFTALHKVIYRLDPRKREKNYPFSVFFSVLFLHGSLQVKDKAEWWVVQLGMTSLLSTG